MKQVDYKKFLDEGIAEKALREKILRPGVIKPIHIDDRFILDWNKISDKPLTFPPSPHQHDDRYYTESEMDTKLAAQDELSELIDVSISSPIDKDVLTYEAATLKWKNKPSSGGGIGEDIDGGIFTIFSASNFEDVLRANYEIKGVAFTATPTIHIDGGTFV